MELADWLQRIEQQHPVKWDLGLARVGEVGRRLNVLQPAPLVFLVAGTNGKGSTCEYITRLCESLGKTVGKSTSPHLQRFNERIQVQGVAADDAQICAAFAAIDEARGDISLTYFEYGTLASLLIFKWCKVDVAVLEIGLGGRLDAMNIVVPTVTVITRIALDHQAWLGDTRELIGAEKAGIMRAGVPCVVVDPAPPRAITVQADVLGSPVSAIGREFGWSADSVWLQQAGARVVFTDLPPLLLPADSLAAASQAVACAGLMITPAAMAWAAAQGRVAGRFQLLNAPHRSVLDVAHNPDAAVYLRDKLQLLLGDHGRCRAVVGMYADKDYAAVLALLAPLVSHFYCTDLAESRAAPAALLAAVVNNLNGSGASTYARVRLAYEAAVQQSSAADLILVFGSFPVVAGVLDYIDAGE